MQDWNMMHALVHDAYVTVLVSTFCGDAQSIALCSCSRSRSGHPARFVNSFSGLPCVWDVQAEVRTQISESVG
jgi:hypothetical protein